MLRQSTRHIMLIEPAEFYANPETMETNVYQVEETIPAEESFSKALQEFRLFRDMLVENGVIVTVAKGHKGCPDHLFPNWVSTHADDDGRGMILYPMLNENRRAERVPEMIDVLSHTYDLQHDLTAWEGEHKILEATGSLTLDRVNRIAYAALSARTQQEAVEEWCRLMDYTPVIFETENQQGKPIYHTDLVIFIGTNFAGVCSETIKDDYREDVLSSLSAHRDIIELSMEQQKAFCGNALEVIGADDQKFLVMSQKACDALTEGQKNDFLAHVAEILCCPIPTIEKYGGGSARCLMLELF